MNTHDIRRDKRNIRNQVIEECALALEAYHRRNMMWGENNGWFSNAVAAIRALKDKP